MRPSSSPTSWPPIYYPFTDQTSNPDPYKGIADDLELAFYIGQSKVVGGTTTDMVAYGDGGAYSCRPGIGAEDKLPRMVLAAYRYIRRNRATRWSYPTGNSTLPRRPDGVV